MVRIGDRVNYFYNMKLKGTVVGFQQDKKHHMLLEGGSTAYPVRAHVKFDDGSEGLYTPSDLIVIQ